MLNYKTATALTEPELIALIRKIEEKRKRRLFVLCQDIGPVGDEMDEVCVHLFKRALAAEGHLGPVTVLLQSAGGDIDCAYRMVRLLREQADDVEVLVSRWAKSAATFFCLGANAIYMAKDAELGPLDTQVLDPKGSVRRKSALQAFKSLEYLREHVLEALDQITLSLVLRYRMDIPNALEAARPLVASLVSPLYQQLDPHELGESRLYLAVGEEYSKIVMRRYSYPTLDADEIERIVKKLVWEYPSHGFVIDLEQIQELGLNAYALDPETTEMCEDLTRAVDSCIGMAPAWVTPARRTRTPRSRVATPAPIGNTLAEVESNEEGEPGNGGQAPDAARDNPPPAPVTVLGTNGSQDLT